MEVKGCVALVTGGNRGIGRGFVDELVDAGADHTVEDLKDTEGILQWILGNG